MSDKEKGLYGKYKVSRLDGSSKPGGKHHGCEYYVLDLMHDKFARPALLAYAEACQTDYPLLAADLRRMCNGKGAGEARNAANSAALRLNADLARVTEELEAMKRESSSRFGLLAEARAEANRKATYATIVEGHNREITARYDAAQERIQALEGMVGMLRGALAGLVELKRHKDLLGKTALYEAEQPLAWESAHKAMSLTESQAAEVVRGMKRVVETSFAYHRPGGRTLKNKQALYDALAAHEAVRGLE